jgi:hypothetical protein
MGCQGWDWIELTQVRIEWRAFVYAVNLGNPRVSVEFLAQLSNIEQRTAWHAASHPHCFHDEDYDIAHGRARETSAHRTHARLTRWSSCTTALAIIWAGRGEWRSAVRMHPLTFWSLVSRRILMTIHLSVCNICVWKIPYENISTQSMWRDQTLKRSVRNKSFERVISEFEYLGTITTMK